MNWFRSTNIIRKVQSKAEEEVFDTEQRKIEELDTGAQLLLKSIEKLTVASADQARLESKLGNDLFASDVCQSDIVLKTQVTEIARILNKQDKLMQEMVNTIHVTYTEPMKKLASVFPHVNECLKKREQVLQEFAKSRSKVDKCSEKNNRTGPNIAKLERSKKEEETAKKEYQTNNSALLREMPKLYESRTQYFRPCYESFIKSEMNFYSEMEREFESLVIDMDCSIHEQSDQIFEQHMKMKINELKNLSIVDEGV